MARPLSKRGDVATFLAMDVYAQATALAQQGREIIHLEVGQPATAAPKLVREYAKELIDNSLLAYSDATGIGKVRQRIAQYYADHYNIDLDPNRVIITTGSSAGFVLSFAALFDAGDKVGVIEPGYPAYPNILKALSIDPVRIPVHDDPDFVPAIHHIEQAGPLDGLLLASPSNPTGSITPGDRLGALIEVIEAQNGAFISDEIYHGITFNDDHRDAPTALSYSDNAVVVSSFSKYFSMTGWRIGWMVVPDYMVDPVTRLQQSLYISPPTLSQLATLKVFDAFDELEDNVTVYKRNREILITGLKELGFAPSAADGAFYTYVDISSRSDDSSAFCSAMLNEAGIAATPGADFDSTQGHNYVRMSFSGATQDIEEAIRRLKVWLQA